MKTLKEFSGSYFLPDGLIKGINILYESTSSEPTIVMLFECMSIPSKEDDEWPWVYLEVRLYEVSEFNIKSRFNVGTDVINDFLAEHWDNKIIFNINPCIGSEQTMPINEHRESDFYVICKAIDFEEKAVIQ